MQRRFLAALAVGYILMFFSEFLFVNVYPRLEWTGLLPMWLAYSIEAYVFLAVVAYFRVRSLGALFLAGAVYGWLLEGVVVQTMYAAFPFQIAWTGLSWHALIDVLVGWYLVRQTLHTASLWRTARLAALIGLFWGFWALWEWQEHDLMSTGSFTLLAFGTALPLIPAYWGINRLGVVEFQPGKLAQRILIGLHLFVFAFVVIAFPPAVLMLPPLLALVYGALRRHQRSQSPATIQVDFTGHVRAVQYALLLLIPAVAAGLYGVGMALEARIASNQIVAVITVPISVVVFVMALVKLYRE
jgi:hypothetical protein